MTSISQIFFIRSERQSSRSIWRLPPPLPPHNTWPGKKKSFQCIVMEKFSLCTCLLLLPEASNAVTRDKLPPIKPLKERWSKVSWWETNLLPSMSSPSPPRSLWLSFDSVSMSTAKDWRTKENNYEMPAFYRSIISTLRYAVLAAILSWCSLAAESIASWDVSVQPDPRWPITIFFWNFWATRKGTQR